MAKKRGCETARDMIFSMGAVLLTVFIILGVTYRSHSQQSFSPNYQAALQLAIQEGSWPIQTPTKLPADYQLTQARFEPESYGKPGQSRWYLGYQTPNNRYLSIWQTDGPLKKIVASASNNGICSGSVSVADSIWFKCENAKPESRVIYRPLGADSVIISGTVSFAELQNVAANLTAVTKSQ